VVTSLAREEQGRRLFEKLWCARGKIEPHP
jgi:hypothetical protein